MTLPACRCGVTVLRPTFGVVGRTGVMSISESLVVSNSSFLCASFTIWRGDIVMLEFIFRLFDRISLAFSVEV